jgi:glycosyltransferase involved in cell wall biosynthesis
MTGKPAEIRSLDAAHSNTSKGVPPAVLHLSEEIVTAVGLSPVRVVTPGRPEARGKFLYAGDEKLYVRGVTYGTFAPGADGSDYPRPAVVASDFSHMRENGINAVRTYTCPPRWLLDLAAEHGLRVMVGLAWEQHVAFLEERARRKAIERRVKAGVEASAGHPAILCYSIGNEIPASIVRWYGRRPVERFLERLYRAARAEDPEALFTYANYPSTEYLRLPFLDLVCFNVYLEQQDRLESYVGRLQNLAGERPLVLAELGLDSRRNGETAQATMLGRMVRTAFPAGCAGTFVFSWTDEWYRGGSEVDDWDFGLVDRGRQPKPALSAVRDAFEETPFAPDVDWPRMTVCVCTRNGARTLRDCLEGIAELDYPAYETIVVDDGSTDETVAIAEQFGARILHSHGRGLSVARNLGLETARGQIIAYLDDDARPDPQWLRYLATTFMTTTHVGVGGPNIAPADSGMVAECVDRTPGGPTQVLLTDREAEHIPGCNMAFRKAPLEEIGGFDPQFRVAGDDVDICWRLQERGWTLGFNPTAVVWHRRRDSVRAHWRQQRGYGKAEGLLARKWPQKYSRGQARWAGRVYHPGVGARRWRIYYGIWGSGAFQPLQEGAPETRDSLLLLPQWYGVLALLVGLTANDSISDDPLLFRLPALRVPLAALLLAVWLAAPLVQAGRSAWRALAPFAGRGRARWHRWPLTAALHVLQPVARFVGRLGARPLSWRRDSMYGFALPRPRTVGVWCEEWSSATQRLHRIEAAMQARGITVLRGGPFERWDLHLKIGWLGGARLRMAVEEHGEGRQLLRFRVWPRWSAGTALTALGLLAVCALTLAGGSVGPAALTGVAIVAVIGRGLVQASAGLGVGLRTAEQLDERAQHDRRPNAVAAPDVAALEET